MPQYEVTRHIKATPDRIWPILTDPDRLSDGTFSILAIEGDIAQGRTIRLRSEADPKRVFAITVSAVEPQTRMVWESGMPLGLFTGRREFRLTPGPDGTEFLMREVYTGPLSGLMFRMIPDLQPTFDKFAAGLAAAAEDQHP